MIMSEHTHTAGATVSPMTMIRRLLALRRSKGDDSLTLDVIERQASRETEQVREATTEAREIEQRVHRFSDAVRSGLADDGVIDTQEAAGLVSIIAGADRLTHTHTRRLEALS